MLVAEVFEKAHEFKGVFFREDGNWVYNEKSGLFPHPCPPALAGQVVQQTHAFGVMRGEVLKFKFSFSNQL